MTFLYNTADWELTFEVSPFNFYRKIVTLRNQNLDPLDGRRKVH